MTIAIRFPLEYSIKRVEEIKLGMDMNGSEDYSEQN